MSSDSDIGRDVEQELEAKPRKSRTAPNRLTNSQKFELLEKYKRGKLDKYYNVIPDKKRKGEFKFVKRRVPLDLPPNYDDDERSSVEQNTGEPAQSAQAAQPAQAAQSAQAVKSLTTSDILKDDKPKYPTEFFQFQANINNSLQKTLDELQNKYDALSNKFDESRKTTPKRTVRKTTPKPKSKPAKPRKAKKQSDEEEYEVVYEYVDEPQKLAEALRPSEKDEAQPPPVQPQPEPQMYVPYIRRRNIDIRNY